MKKYLYVLTSLVLMSLVSCVNEPFSNEKEHGRETSLVAALGEQVVSVGATVDQLAQIQTEIDNLIENAEEAQAQELSGCKTALQNVVASLESHVDYLKGATWFEGTMATIECQKALASVVASLEIAMGQQFDELESSVSTWVGKDFCMSYSAALALARVQLLGISLNTLSADVTEGLIVAKDSEELAALSVSVAEDAASYAELGTTLDAVVSELTQEYAQAVEAVVVNKTSYDAPALAEYNSNVAVVVKSSTITLNDLVARVSVCETKLENILQTIKDLEAQVEGLLGMIQSVTFMPEYTTDNAYAFYNMDIDTKVNDDNLPYNGKAQRTATGEMNLNFIVRPAEASTALNAKPEALKLMGYYATKISQMAVNPADYFELDIKKVVATDDNRGLVTVTVEPRLREAFYYKEIGAKCALSIKFGSTDVTSKFIEISPMENSNRVYVQSVTTSKETIKIKKGESAQLSATVNPGNVTTPGVYWASSNTEIVQIDAQTGKIYANGVGTAVVQAISKGTDEWGLPVSAQCNVEVEEAFMLSGAPYVEVGNTTQLFLTYPTDAIINEKLWKSSDESKLIVDADGNVTGVAPTYNTTTQQYNEVTVSCTINGVTTVSWPMKVAAVQPKKIITNGLAENQGQIEVRVNENLSLASTIYPDNVPEGAYKIIYQSDQGLGWINYDTGVIDANRNSYATTAWVTITVENYDKERYYISDSRVKRVIAVKVIPYYVKTITLSDVEIQIGQAAVSLSPKITSDVDGKAPTNSALTWTSSNPLIATVDQSGKVTPVAAGTATITATAQDGSGVSGSCKVTVTQPWKEFNIGDYVVRESNGDIGFYADLNTAKSNGRSVVGIVISKTNPRVTDTALPASCTHGIAIALGEGEGNWSTNDSEKVGDWAAQNGKTFVTDISKYSGYTNTQALKAFVSARGCSSGIINAVNSYNNSNKSGLPNGTSQYYIPSAVSMKDIANLSGGNENFSNKLIGAGGTGFTNSVAGSIMYYWTVSETSTTPTQAVAVRALTNVATNKSKTASSKVRFVFAF